MSYDRPLLAWLSGQRYYQKSPLYIVNEDFVIKSAWLCIDLEVPLHEVSRIKLMPFDQTWDITLEYINAACSRLGRARPGWAPPKSEADAILDELGLPPLRCYALYLITVEQEGRERCVYVGQTNSKHHRFRSGHAAMTALHHPKFDGSIKRIYLAGIQMEDDDDHMFPVEWIHPIEQRQFVLNSIEARLILDLQPEINKRGRKKSDLGLDLPVRVQNLVSCFLDCAEFGPSQEIE